MSTSKTVERRDFGSRPIVDTVDCPASPATTSPTPAGSDPPNLPQLHSPIRNALNWTTLCTLDENLHLAPWMKPLPQAHLLE